MRLYSNEYFFDYKSCIFGDLTTEADGSIHVDILVDNAMAFLTYFVSPPCVYVTRTAVRMHNTLGYPDSIHRETTYSRLSLEPSLI
jgi:hypothetical protein